MFRELFEASNEKESNGYRFTYTFGRSDHNDNIGKIGTKYLLGGTPVNQHFSIDDILAFYEKVTKGGVTATNLKNDTEFMAWLKKRAKISKAKGV
jgi:hypothetical protein